MAHAIPSTTLVLAAALAMAAAPARSAPALAVVGYELAAQRRIGPTVYEYVYRIKVRNTGTAAEDVEVSLREVPPGITPVQRTVGIASLPASATATSNARVVVRHDRTKPFRFDALQWVLRARDGGFDGRLAGAADAPAASALKDYLAPPGPRDTVTDGDGTSVELTQLIVEIKADATIGQVNGLLQRVDGRITSMGKGRRLMSVAIRHPGSLAGLDASIALLLQAPGVAAVWPSLNASPNLLPSNPPYAAPTAPAFYQDDGDKRAASRYLHHHLAVRAAAAWNLAGLLESPLLKDRRPVMVYEDFFGHEVPDHNPQDEWQAAEPRLWGAQFAAIDFEGDFTVRPVTGTHGYDVASVAGASFGDKSAEEKALVTGLYPAQLETRVVNLNRRSHFDASAALVDLIASYNSKEVPANFLKRNVILNSSIGICPPGTPCPESMRLGSALEARNWIEGVRGRLLDEKTGQPTFLHVYAAGNTTWQWSYFDFPGAADDSLPVQVAADDALAPFLHPGGFLASLVYKPGIAPAGYRNLKLADLTPLLDAAGQPVVLDKLQNMLGVESRLNTYTRLESIPGDSSAGIPPSTRQIPPTVTCHASYSSSNGSIAAMGGAGFGDLWTLGGAGGPAHATAGTSFASPQVAATAAWVWSLAPQLSPAEVKQIILDTVRPSEGMGCGAEEGFHDALDVYSAVLATDNTAPPGSPLYKNLGDTTDAPARAWLLDVAGADANGGLLSEPDGKFTQADLMKFLREFEKRHGDQTPDYSRYDLNGNGVTGEPPVRRDIRDQSRFDLDGDRLWADARKPVEGIERRFAEDMTSDIEVLIYYAYSPLYQGNAYERTMLLLPYLQRLTEGTVLYLDRLDLNLPAPSARTALFSLRAINGQGEQYASRCPSERGAPFYSGVVQAQAAQHAPLAKVQFWRPELQAGGLVDKSFTTASCSSFVAALPASGLVWVQSAARHVEAAASEDIEYQTRFFLGEPDLGAAPDPQGKFQPPARRAATQKLSYGIVDQPGSAFRPVFETSAFFATQVLQRAP